MQKDEKLKALFEKNTQPSKQIATFVHENAVGEKYWSIASFISDDQYRLAHYVSSDEGTPSIINKAENGDLANGGYTYAAAVEELQAMEEHYMILADKSPVQLRASHHYSVSREDRAAQTALAMKL